MNNPEPPPPPPVGPIHLHTTQEIVWPVESATLQEWATSLLQSEGKGGEVHLILTDDAAVRQLNMQFRQIDKTTDVLSFPWNQEASLYGEGSFLGEIYLSLPQIERQAPRYGTTLAQELQRVVIHGLLHLCGYDHQTAPERQQMRLKEEQYLQRNPYLSPPL